MAGLGNKVGTNFSLRSRMNGSATLAGKSVQVWYFTDGSPMSGKGFMGNRYLPSAHIEPIEGQAITINFTNNSPMAHTIHLHGLDVDQANDGVPTTSFEVAPLGSYKYKFTAPHAGTYHYHCHVDTVIHYARGMVGAVIVRPPGGATNVAWAGGPSFDEEVLWQLHTADTSWYSLSASGSANARFNPDAFFINGKETAGAMGDAFSKIVSQVGKPVYLRLLNCGYQWARVSLGGAPFEVVASDGRPMKQSYATTTLDLGPGERYDLLFTPTSAGTSLGLVEYFDDYTGAVLGTAQTRITVT
jgi:FtsP/CotA-like multicopper oxidase with cupredoxin domain